jgi:hypothetical protein
VLAEPANYRTYKTRDFNIRVYDVDGKLYNTWLVKFPCSESAACKSYTAAMSSIK